MCEVKEEVYELNDDITSYKTLFERAVKRIKELESKVENKQKVLVPTNNAKTGVKSITEVKRYQM